MIAISPWGKTSGEGTHHLAHHCADVAACFEMVSRLPVVRNRLEYAAERTLSNVDIARLCVIAFLHDCGKLHPGFQAKGWPKEVWRNPFHGHSAEGEAIFCAGICDWKIAENLGCAALSSWGDSVGSLLIAALSHHGKPVSKNHDASQRASQRWNSVPQNGYDPVGASQEIGNLLPIWFPTAFEGEAIPLPESPKFQHLFCGLVSLADWLGSEQRLFKFVPELDHNYITKARALALQAVKDIGLETSQWHASLKDVSDFGTLSPNRTPRAAQQKISTWPLDDPLVILEAETGSGKTEAALWRFAKLFDAGVVDSLYFALPTRAAAKQIHGRVNQVMKNLFGENAPEAVLAIPGYIRMGDTEGKALPDFRVLWDDEANRKDTIARWSAENAKRFLAATIAVGTVDQAMLSALQVKHAHLRSSALSRSLVVIDEVHASDCYMMKIQKHLLDIHIGRGGHAMLMSATLGSAARTRWLESPPPSFDEALSTSYPAVWGLSTPYCAVSPDNRKKTVSVSHTQSWTGEDAANHAISAAQNGARVLVVRNTVKAALETFTAIEKAGAEQLLWHVDGAPALHHSRFAAEDRRILDGEVEKALSPDERIRPNAGVIVIGTQTLEQSLDICADYLVTDLCPVDVLLQRVGRLHRHPLQRPRGFDVPQCIVLSPEGGLDRFATPTFENGLGRFKDGGGVYENLHACELTRRLILSHPEWVIPDMNRFLVESATHDEKIAALSREKGQQWENYFDSINGKAMAETGAARRNLLPVTEHFCDLHPFACDEEAIRTRLGAEGAFVRFPERVFGPFGVPISGISLPSHWSKGIETSEPVEPKHSSDDSGLIFSLGCINFRYTRRGLEKMEIK